jgi:membrane-bound ClpP family serine protease
MREQRKTLVVLWESLLLLIMGLLLLTAQMVNPVMQVIASLTAGAMLIAAAVSVWFYSKRCL